MPKTYRYKSILILGAGPVLSVRRVSLTTLARKRVKPLREERLPRHSGELQPGDHHDRPGNG